MFQHKKKHLFQILQKGFTYVEGILAIGLTLVASTAIAFSVQKAIKVYKSQQLKDKAVEALIQYTEDYRMMVAYGEHPFPGKQPRGENGHRIVLYDAEDEKDTNLSWGGRELKSYAYLFHDVRIVRESSECSKVLGEKKPYYNIKTWIEWDDVFDKQDDNTTTRNRKNLSFEVNQSVIVN